MAHRASIEKATLSTRKQSPGNPVASLAEAACASCVSTSLPSCVESPGEVGRRRVFPQACRCIVVTANEHARVPSIIEGLQPGAGQLLVGGHCGSEIVLTERARDGRQTPEPVNKAPTPIRVRINSRRPSVESPQVQAESGGAMPLALLHDATRLMLVFVFAYWMNVRPHIAQKCGKLCVH